MLAAITAIRMNSAEMLNRKPFIASHYTIRAAKSPAGLGQGFACSPVHFAQPASRYLPRFVRDRVVVGQNVLGVNADGV